MGAYTPGEGRLGIGRSEVVTGAGGLYVLFELVSELGDH
jgi:hypothetical protein